MYQNNSVLAHRERVANKGEEEDNYYKLVINNNSSVDDGLISPVSVVVSDQAPPPSLHPGEKCEYLQMKGDKLEGNCMKGGMSCERKCKYSTKEPVCTTVLTVTN